MITPEQSNEVMPTHIQTDGFLFSVKDTLPSSDELEAKVHEGAVAGEQLEGTGK